MAPLQVIAMCKLLINNYLQLDIEHILTVPSIGFAQFNNLLKVNLYNHAIIYVDLLLW
jgi:hypothetical protein